MHNRVKGLSIMKFSKRILSLFVSITMLIIISVNVMPAYADEKNEPKISFSASLQIVSCPGAVNSASGSGILGHSFLIVKNIGVSTITVGHMSVPVGQSITIGTFNNRKNHKGIWYNIEGYNGINATCYGLTTGLTGSQLNTFNNTLNNNDTWTVTKNCSYFAKTVWNSVNSPDTLSGTNPLSLANSIKKKSGYITNPSIPKKGINTIARQTANGIVYDSSGASPS